MLFFLHVPLLMTICIFLIHYNYQCPFLFLFWNEKKVLNQFTVKPERKTICIRLSINDNF